MHCYYIPCIVYNCQSFSALGILIKDNFNQKTWHQQPGYDKESTIVFGDMNHKLEGKKILTTK